MNVETANHLQMLRKKNNLSQEELAEKIGISRQAVSKWERAEASPDTDNLILLAKLYGVTLDELLRTESDPLPNSEGISLRKEDYIYGADKNADDGEIYPDGRQSENNSVPQGAPGMSFTQTDDDKKPQQEASADANSSETSEKSDTVAGFTANVIKDAFRTAANAFNDANEKMKNGMSMESAYEESFEKHFEDFGARTEKKGQEFEKNTEQKFSASQKEPKKKYPPTLMDKLFPLIICCFFLMFGAIGFWHPAWLIAFLIPIYYIWVNPMRRFQHGDIPFLKAFRQFVDGALPIAVTFLFLTFGIFTGGWRVFWTIFLLIPLYYTGVEAVKKRNPLVFCYPALVLWFYCTAGCLFMRPSVWLYMTPLFITIPFYYIILDHIRKNKKN